MKKTLMLKAPIVALALLLAGGCAVGSKHRFYDVAADIAAPGVKSVAIATHDQRGYIKSGEKLPNFVGLQRAGFGNPYNVNTASGGPLADDMTGAIKNSLANKGVTAVPVTAAVADDEKAVLEKLKAAGGDRLILLILREWKSDTYQNTKLTYDMSLTVYDKTGKPLGESSLNGADNLGGSAWDPAKHARRAVPMAFKEKIEKLFSDPKIAQALQ